MKRNIKKPLCITLCTLLLAGSIGIAAHAAVPNEKNLGTAAASNGTAGLNSLNSDMLAAAAPSASTGSPLSDAYEQNSKTETVYVFASAMVMSFFFHLVSRKWFSLVFSYIYKY